MTFGDPTLPFFEEDGLPIGFESGGNQFLADFVDYDAQFLDVTIE